MKRKHLQIRINQCFELAKASECPRAKYGALLIDPKRNVILADGYNGGPRNGTHLCGDSLCLRQELKIPSGTQVQIGCHHAEMNVICNAAAQGTPTNQAWLIVTGEPCLMCAKLIHHAGITKVITISNSYSTTEGVEYLKQNGVGVEYWKEKEAN